MFTHDYFSSPIVSIEIDNSGATPTVGEIYAITCSVTGANPTIYQWNRDGILLSEKGSTISFSPFRLSDAGLYTCEVTLHFCTLTRSHQISLTSKANISTLWCNVQ